LRARFIFGVFSNWTATPCGYASRRVIAGLDPAIHHLRKISFAPLTRPMDGRVKPGHDDSLIHRQWKLF
jgi:hypothetical protein